MNLVARATVGGIVLEGKPAGEARVERWSFSDIAQESFLWRGEASFDDGATWALAQEMRVRRRA